MPMIEYEGVQVITPYCNWTGEDAIHNVLIFLTSEAELLLTKCLLAVHISSFLENSLWF